MKPPVLPDPLVVVLAAADDPRDVVPDQVVVLLVTVPVGLDLVPDQRFAEPADDGRLGEQVVRDRFDAGPRRGARRRRCPPRRRTAGRTPGYRSRCGPSWAGSGPPAPVTVWDRLSLVEIWTVSSRVLHGRLGGVGVRDGTDEVAAQRDEDPDLAVAHLVDGLDGVHAVFAGRFEAELLAEGVHEGLRHLLPDAHGAVALHVAVARGWGRRRRRACRCCRAAGAG